MRKILLVIHIESFPETSIIIRNCNSIVIRKKKIKEKEKGQEGYPLSRMFNHENFGITDD